MTVTVLTIPAVESVDATAPRRGATSTRLHPSRRRKGRDRRRTRRGSVSAVPGRRDAALYSAARSIARGRIERALHGYLRILADDPADLPMLNRTGELLVRAGEIARGVDMLLRVARGYETAGFARKAAAVYRKVLRFAPGCLAARRQLVVLYRERGLHGEALAITGEVG